MHINNTHTKLSHEWCTCVDKHVGRKHFAHTTHISSTRTTLSPKTVIICYIMYKYMCNYVLRDAIIIIIIVSLSRAPCDIDSLPTAWGPNSAPARSPAGPVGRPISVEMLAWLQHACLRPLDFAASGHATIRSYHSNYVFLFTCVYLFRSYPIVLCHVGRWRFTVWPATDPAVA